MNKNNIESKEEQKINRLDYNLIVKTVKENSKVLDLGCSMGTLLALLKEKKQTDGRGIEINPKKVQKCIEQGFSVLHGDLDEGLKHYADNSFDYVIFNQTIQVVKNSLLVLQEALRVGKKVIVSFPNFGHWQTRLSFAFSGKMPKSKALPYEWYNTPNIRILTIKDFRDLCNRNDVNILKEKSYLALNGKNRLINFWPNTFATNSLFILEQNKI
ncbi:MAG: methionine biosynthesis protein MetW [Candidatus Woesearchaeota archaeon]|jgi:methionine biosynthesis protein MetW|nr:methionine biosynthesis protein MetW [Candidatus Woesearchaeota archaeon]